MSSRSLLRLLRNVRKDIPLDTVELRPLSSATVMRVLRLANIGKRSPIPSFAFGFANTLRPGVAVYQSRCIATLIVGALLGGCAHHPSTLPHRDPFSGPRFCEATQGLSPVQIVAHRGEIRKGPENTLPAYQGAIDAGYEWIETDIRLSADGHHVIFHDDRLDAISNGRGPLRLKTLSELKSLEIHARHNTSLPNARMLTLEELLQFARGKIKLVLDCKAIDPPLLIEQIRAAEMTGQVLVSAGKATLRKVNAASQGTVPVMARYRGGSLSGLIASLSPAVVQIYGNKLTPGLVRTCRQAEVCVMAQTLGRPDRPEIWRTVARLGADFIMTDFGEDVRKETSIK